MDTQSECKEDVAMENPVARFLMSLIAVCKENRDVLKSLPEMIESLIASEEHLPNLIEVHQFEEYRYQSSFYCVGGIMYDTCSGRLSETGPDRPVQNE